MWPYLITTRNGYEDIVDKLVNGFEIDNEQNKVRNRRTLLSILEGGLGWRVENQNLLEAKPNLDLQNDNGETPLMIAAAEGHTRIVQILVTKGARLDEQDNDFDTALVKATRNKHTEIVEILIEKGADDAIQNKDGNTALILAASFSGMFVGAKGC